MSTLWYKSLSKTPISETVESYVCIFLNVILVTSLPNSYLTPNFSKSIFLPLLQVVLSYVVIVLTVRLF